MSSEEIQNEIERTRGEMASTLQAIERKLSPRQLMDQAVDTMRDFAGESSRVTRAVREYPIPLALIGLGLGWLAVSGMRSREEDETLDLSPGETGVGSAWDATSAASGAPGYGSPGYGTSGYDSSGYGTEGITIGGDGQSIKDRARQAVEQARERVGETAEEARRRVSQWSRSARSRAGEAADSTWEAYQEHPLAMGLAAVFLGATIGALLPRTRPEQRVMGGAAESVMRSGGELVDKAGRIASRTMRTAKQEAGEAVRNVTETAREEASREGLGPEGVGPSTLTH